MATALIGYTGFVGSNLLKQSHFDELYNSSNIESIKGKSFTTIVCAGAPAAKWLANKNPDKDMATIKRLITCLEDVKAENAVLISTVDVYSNPRDVDEDTPVSPDDTSPYGKHRYMLEVSFQDLFPSTIIRLPGLFGAGLKKNIIYDFINKNALELICPESVFQFYCLDNLWQDIENTIKNNIPLINFATEPLSVKDIAQDIFNFDFRNPQNLNPAFYNLKTKYDARFNGKDGYIYMAEQIKKELKNYVKSEGYYD